MPPSASATTVQEDFNRIARLPESAWDHNAHYHAFLLRHVPTGCAAALEVGCGTGALSRKLARRAGSVLAVDFAPEMIRVARERSAGCANIEYRLADILACDLPIEHFDCIASIATFHHLPVEAALRRLVPALKPGGVLVILDLVRPHNLASFLPSLAAMPLSLMLKLLKTRHLGEPEEQRAAWAAHAPKDQYLSIPEAQRMYTSQLPGARVRLHLFWRYSVVWVKPGPTQNRQQIRAD